jgi:uncharacterized protein (DUF983 family)
MMAANVWTAGLLCRCPACGQAPLFDGLLTIKDRCGGCGANLSAQDSGDGPAVFVILVAGAIMVPAAIIGLLVLKIPTWAMALLLIPMTLGLCVALLRPFKALLFAAHYVHRAGEGRVRHD